LVKWDFSTPVPKIIVDSLKMLSMLLFLSGIISEKMLKRISKRFCPSAISLETKKLLIWASGLKTAKLMNLLLGD
jgi:hypothetical protein